MKRLFSKDEFLIKLTPDKDSLLGKLQEIDELASDLRMKAMALFDSIHETENETVSGN